MNVVSLGPREEPFAVKGHDRIRTYRFMSAVALTALLAGCGIVKVVPPEEDHPRLSVPTNLSFEDEANKDGAEGWWRTEAPKGAYVMKIVDSPTKDGDRSANIAYSKRGKGPSPSTHDAPAWGAWNQTYDMVPNGGKTLHVKGWIKTRNAETCELCEKPGQTNDSLAEGDRRGAEIRLNLYKGEEYPSYTAITPLITGTKDWTLFEATAVVPEGTTMLILAPILWGKGEAWFDGLELTIK